jgi:ABC-2 type transport system ATP-binding protein
MDEAERCHRIAYISYGKLIAKGAVDEVVKNAGLSTMLVSGAAVAEAAKRLAGAPGVEQIAHFGATLHVVGSDGAALRKAVMAVAKDTGTHAETAQTSLEDVFIQLMSDAEDNMQ